MNELSDVITAIYICLFVWIAGAKRRLCKPPTSSVIVGAQRRLCKPPMSSVIAGAQRRLCKLPTSSEIAGVQRRLYSVADAQILGVQRWTTVRLEIYIYPYEKMRGAYSSMYYQRTGCFMWCIRHCVCFMLELGLHGRSSMY